MTRTPFISTLVLPFALIGLAACDDANRGARDKADSTGGTEGAEEVPRAQPSTEPNLRVAFIGDQDVGSDTTAVLDLVKSEGADFLVIAGDFNYDDNPGAWNDQNVEHLGADYPIFAVAGNHDKAEWSGFQSHLIDRTQNAIDDGAICTGEIGENSTCLYKGLFLAMSGVDVVNSKGESEDHLRNALANDDSVWSVCVWHKNMQDMQVGGKSNDTGWGVYQACQDEGAIIITGHEHSYSRSLTLTNLGNEAAGHGATGDPELMIVREGSTFVSVTGVGGRGLRDYEEDKHDDDTWWSSIYTTDMWMKNQEISNNYDAVDGGVLFIDFNIDGNPNKAHGYFKTIGGEVLDEYDIVRDLDDDAGGDGDGDADPTGDGDGDADPTGDGDGDMGGGDDGDCLEEEDDEPGIPGELIVKSFDDGYVDSDKSGDNYASDNMLLIDGNPTLESYIRPLGLDAVPANATVTKATLRLFSINAGGTAEARQVTEPWDLASLSYSSRPSVTAQYTSFETPVGWVEIDVTAFVKSWVNGAPVYGIQLSSDDKNGSDYFSSDKPGANAPELVIEYTI